MHTMQTFILMMPKHVQNTIETRHESASWPKKLHFTGWQNYHDVTICVHAIPHILKKFTKNNKMKKVTLKIGNMHFFGQLQAWDCRNIKKDEKHAKQKNGKSSKRMHINWQ